jgi:MoaA/NifB/PqqE/SkfB family radical SAM enzyme
MTFDFFRSIIGSHPGVECIWPHGFGEPLLHQGIFDFIRFAKSVGKTVSLSTNISLLDETAGAELIGSRLDYLVLPIDGTTAATYASNRNAAALVDIEARVERLLALKAARGSKLHITVQMVRMRNNAHEIDAFRRRWQRPGVNSIRVRDDLSGLPGVRIEGKQARPSVDRPCFYLWRGPLFVQSRGTIIPCPYYHGAEPYGDLRSQHVAEAWNSGPMRAIRDAHRRGDLSNYPVCARCPRHQPHRALAATSFFVTTHHIRRVIPRLEDFQRRFGWKFVE